MLISRALKQRGNAITQVLRAQPFNASVAKGVSLANGARPSVPSEKSKARPSVKRADLSAKDIWVVV